MAVNYEDDRFLQVEEEKNQALENTNQQFEDLLNEREDLTNQQNDLVNKWEQTQNENLDNQLQFQKDLIEQQRQEAQKAYEKEAKSAYTDYRKETDAYGVSREQQVGAGMGNTGYSESSKVSMYNTYQNRLATSKETMDKAYMEFDNAIREAQLTNDVTKAENALSALQQKLQIALEAFNYKNTNTQNKLQWQQQINSDYYNRYQDVLNQINYENEQAEAIRQYNEQMEFQRQQAELAKQQWEREFALQQQQAAAQQRAYAQQQAYYESLKDTSNQQQTQSQSSGSSIMGTDAGKSLYDRLNMLKKQNTLGMSSSQMKEFLAAQVNSAYQKGEINQADVNNILNKLGIK